jgi:hypothetical protein
VQGENAQKFNLATHKFDLLLLLLLVAFIKSTQARFWADVKKGGAT